MLLLLLLLLTLLSAAIQEQHGAPCFNINFVALPRLHPTQLANLTKACSASNRCSVQSCNKKNACDKKNACHKKNACDKRNAFFQVLQGTGLYGAGDFLMSFLGVIILSFAFKIFDQRRLMVRHAPEILGSCAVSAGVSMVGTAVLCRLAGLDSSRPSSASLHLFSLFMIGTAVLCRLADLDPSRPSSTSVHVHFWHD